MKERIVEILSNVISYLLGFATAIFAEPIRQRIFKPKLNLEFDRESCISKTCEFASGTKVGEARYIRIKVTNKSRIIAKDCRAYLINIEKRDISGRFIPTVYCDSIPLAWSCQGRNDRYGVMDIPKGVNQYLDIVVTRNTSEEFDPQIMAKPFRYSNLFKEVGVFRFTIQGSTAGADPVNIKLIFEWQGIWDKFNIDAELKNNE